MFARTGKVVIERTVPLYFDHSHRVSGLYSQMMGRLVVSAFAQSVSLLSVVPSQPGVEGMPS